jgi:hypothetical protein
MVRAVATMDAKFMRFFLILFLFNCVTKFNNDWKMLDSKIYLDNRVYFNEMKPLAIRNQVQNGDGKLRILIDGELKKIPNSFKFFISKKEPSIYRGRQFHFYFGIETFIPYFFGKTIPAYKEINSDEVYEFKLDKFDTELSLPSGEYYASLSNGEIETGMDVDLPIFSNRWNQGLLLTFGYKYDSEKDTLILNSPKNCESSSIKNIHNIGKIYDPRGNNNFSCPQILIDKRTTTIRINSIDNEKHYIRTFFAWVPGVILFAPFVYGRSMNSLHYTLQISKEIL